MGKKPSVGRVNLHHVKAAFLAQLCRRAIRAYDLPDQRLRHFPHLSRRRAFRAGPVCHSAAAHIPADTGQAPIFSAVGQLYVGVSAAVMDCPGGLGQSLPDAERIQLQLLVVGFPGGRVHNRFAVSHHRRAAARLFLQIGDHLRCEVALRGNHAGAGGRGDDPVFQPDIPQAQRAEQLRVLPQPWKPLLM